MTRRSVQRWSEASLLFVSFGSLSIYGIFSLWTTAVQSWGGSELEESIRAGSVAQPRRSLAARPLVAGSLVEGSVVGRVEIPEIDVSAVVLEGVSAGTLRVAAGHVPETALPRENGNAAIAAHRDTLFRNLEAVRPGNLIVVRTPRGTFRYRVSWTGVVNPRDTFVLDSTGSEALTLVTCYPFRYAGPAPERFIVRAAPGRN